MISPARLLLTGLGTGYLRPAPGTWGSAAVIGIYLLATAACGSAGCVNVILAVLVASTSVVCVVLGASAETLFGAKDPSQVTIDEWAGQAVALLALPTPAAWRERLIVAAAAFVAFRLFDILKPPPARQFERLPQGWGILADDLAAGVYANLAAQLILRLGLHLS